jgi:hypothetical protein
METPLVRPDNYYVLSDSSGFVGAFYTIQDAAREVLKYNLIPFIVQKFSVAPGPVDRVWVVLYRDLDAVAFVSNNREEAEKVQLIYGRVGLSYPDYIDYWEQYANTINPNIIIRLESLSRAHSDCVGEASEAELKQRELDDIERVSRLIGSRLPITTSDNITILDEVIPIGIGGEAPNPEKEIFSSAMLESDIFKAGFFNKDE